MQKVKPSEPSVTVMETHKINAPYSHQGRAKAPLAPIVCIPMIATV